MTLGKFEVCRKTYEIATKESHLFQFPEYQDRPQNVGRRLGCGREYDLP